VFISSLKLKFLHLNSTYL